MSTPLTTINHIPMFSHVTSLVPVLVVMLALVSLLENWYPTNHDELVRSRRSPELQVQLCVRLPLLLLVRLIVLRSRI